MEVRMLVVDDEQLQLDLIVGVMKKLFPHYLVDTASKPSDALRLVLTGRYNVLMTDVRMPEMDGLELLRRVREAGIAPMQFVILSGYGEFGYAQQALSCGVVEYLLKPVSRAALLQTLPKVLAALQRECQPGGDSEARMLSMQERNFALYKLLHRLETSEHEQYITQQLRFQEKPHTLVVFDNPQRVRGALERLEDEGVCLVNVEDRAAALLFPSERMSADALALRMTADGECRAAIAPGEAGESLADTFERGMELLETARALGVGTLRRASANGEPLRALREAVSAGDRQAVRSAGAPLRMAMLGGAVSMKDAREAVRLGLEGSADCSQAGRFTAEIGREYWDDVLRRIGESATPEALVALAEALIPGDGEADAFLSGCVAYIAAHHGSDCSLPKIAQAFHYSPSHFSRLFANCFHMPYSNYLLTYRLQAACGLLLTTDLPAGEVARRVGILDPSYFNRQFRKRYGVAPQQFRRRGG